MTEQFDVRQPKPKKDHKNNKIFMYTLSFVGSAIEYYNYMLFIYLMPYWSTMLGDVNQGQISGFGIVLIAALFRPFAADIIGIIADSFSRKLALFIAASVSAVASIIMSCLPLMCLYVSNKVILLCIVSVCRLLNVISAASSLNNSPIFLMDQDPGKKGFISGFMWAGSVFGMFMAAVAEFYSTETSWAYFFSIGAMVWFVGFLIMFFVKEGQRKNHKIGKQDASVSKLTINSRDIATIAIAGGISGSFYYLTAYIPIVVGKSNTGFRLHTLFVYVLSVFLSGSLSDLKKTDSQKFLGQSMILCAVLLLPLCVLNTYMVNKHCISLTQLFSIIALGGFVGPSHKLLYNMHPDHCRSRSISRNYSIGTSIFGGCCGYICIMLNKIHSILPSVFCCLCLCLFIFGVTSGTKRMLSR